MTNSSVGFPQFYQIQQILNRFLDIGQIDWSNNAAERNMKSYVMGRKNFLFSYGPEGAKANAVLMTITETAKANGLDPMKYIAGLLKELSQYPEFRKSQDLGDYLPWHWRQTESQSAKA
ncbi:IS66 family transposase [Lactiplantibacillus plantarum]|uniref:IS66 family transposase n=1 Tax=Lactiplantibacillus plantarum TaxID=1590 RepID=UPI00107647C0|nr:transposase [Lactiplantibacillus plantarum]TFZ21289.1 transposase [Lactiplantibacillus plantarum]